MEKFKQLSPKSMINGKVKEINENMFWRIWVGPRLSQMYSDTAGGLTEDLRVADVHYEEEVNCSHYAECPSSFNTDKPTHLEQTDIFIRVWRTFNGNQIATSENGAGITGWSVQRNEIKYHVLYIEINSK